MPETTSPPLGLLPGDFDALRAPVRGAGARVVERRRQELRTQVLAWAHGVAARLDQLGVPVEARAVERALPRRALALGAVLFRGPPARGTRFAHARHARLLLELHPERVTAALEIPPAAEDDVAHLRARLGDPVATVELLDAIARLPDELDIGVAAGPRTACAACGRDTIERGLDLAARTRGAWTVAWEVPRELAAAHADALGEQLADVLVALALVYRLVAWRPERADAGPLLVQRGAHVRVLGGPFEGKVGVVGDLDGRGAVRILLGLLSARVPLDTLAPVGEPRARPSLKSSHRRLTPRRGAK